MRPHNRAFAKIRSDLSAMFWPPVSTGSTAVLVAALRQLEDSQWLTPGEIAAAQYRQLGLLAAHCEKFSPHFRDRLRAAGLTAAALTSAGALRRLPLLRRRDLQEADNLFCEEVPAGHAPLNETRTSGSTGEPIVVRRTAVSNFDWGLFTLREYFWQGCDFSRPLCAIRANIDMPARQAEWGPPVSQLFDGTGPSLGIPITTGTGQLIEMIREFAPGSLLVYPSTLAALAGECASRGIALPSLRHIRTVGETLSPELRAEAGRVFAAKMSDCYSSQEVGYIASECPDAPLYHTMETVIVEIVDAGGAPCRAGETGRVVVTDLRNFATPMIRYEIGDYAQAGPSCPCGRGLATLTRIFGRERNLIAMPDGTRHWPVVGGHYFRDIAPIRQFQFIQRERDGLEVRLFSETPLTPAQERELGALITKSLGYPFRLEYSYFDGAIPPGANGKFEEFICLVKDL